MAISTNISAGRYESPIGAVPAAILMGFILTAIPGLAEVVVWLARMPFHEVGHAVVYWLRSIVAIPSFGATLPLYAEPHLVTFLGFVALASWASYRAWKAHYLYAAVTSFLLVPLCVACTFIVPADFAEMAVVWGGLGGELYLSLLAMVFFHQPLPERWNWGKNRYLFLVTGALAFASSLRLWYRAQSDESVLPMGAVFDFGSLLGGESNGDLNRLQRDFGWSAQEIVYSYSRTALICVALLVVYLGHRAYVRWGPSRPD